MVFAVGILVLVGVALTATLAINRGTPTPSRVAASTPAKSPVRASSIAPGRSVDRTPQGGSSARAATQAVTWQYLGSYTTRRIESQYFDVTAHGVYIVAKVQATNQTARDESISDSEVRLDLDGHQYAPDLHATTALELAGRTTLAATALPPSATARGWVAFDVAPSVAHTAASVCFGRTESGQSACLTFA